MKVYHSSYTRIERPDIFHSRDYLDFGKGFYLTHLREQAERYGMRFTRRGQESWLNIYDFDFSDNDWKILRFDNYDKLWLEFVSKCRNGLDDSDYDMVIGGVANDKVIRTLDRYFNGEINEEVALGLLIFEKPNIQYCIRSQDMLERCVKHTESLKL
ncbi:MAG: DUF3990 domain-containing protein [Muribaculaceae bacterium]|nr:DUF3990 domain-containing protein [Muribaculaceae bacterium]